MSYYIPYRDFRKYNFKHRDISTHNILYKVNPLSREYVLLSGKVGIVDGDIQLIIADYNTSIFEPYDINDVNVYNDLIAILEIIQQLVEITEDIDDDTLNNIQILLDDISDNDDLTFEFLQMALDKYY